MIADLTAVAHFGTQFGLDAVADVTNSPEIQLNVIDFA